MTILLIGAHTNATDGVIAEGIRNLLRKALGAFTEIPMFMYDHQEMTIEKHPADLIVVCGTPWLWDSFQDSIKYRNLRKVFAAHKNVPKIFLGIGTCVNLGCIDSDILQRPAEVNGMKQLFKETTVIVRDSLAYTRLSQARIKSTLLPCPAYFCYDNFNFTTREENVMVWCDPRRTISQGDWGNEKRYKGYCSKFVSFYEKHQPKVYCTSESEIPSAVKLGFPAPTVLRKVQDTLDIMARANNVLSGRVHCAIPAQAAGCSTELVPIDSRYLTFQKYTDLPNYERILIEKLSSYR